MVKKSITCISLLFIGYGISYFYLDYCREIRDLKDNELLIGEYFEDYNEKVSVNKIKYCAVLEIPKISFKRGLYDVGSKESVLEKNIVFLDKSDMPDQDNSRVIIVGHSGDTSNSFFKYLYKLKFNDLIYLYYNNTKYTYKITDIYEIKKTGQLALESNNNKTLTLVTCKGSSKQLVIISTLQKEKKL